MGAFTAEIEQWVLQTEGALEAIVRESIQEVVTLMVEPVSAGGHMPVDTSFLQNSLMGSAAQMPQVDPLASGEGGPKTGNRAQVEAVIAGLELGQTLHFGFVAAYAMRQNYGFFGTDSLGRNYSQPGHHFVELAAQQWPQIVAKKQRRLAGMIAFGG